MSQSASLYRISQNAFESLRESKGEKPFEIKSSKDYSIFQGSFQALEFILEKKQNETGKLLIKQIFNPDLSLMPENFSDLSPEIQFEVYETARLINYLDQPTIKQISDLLNKISDTEFQLQ